MNKTVLMLGAGVFAVAAVALMVHVSSWPVHADREASRFVEAMASSDTRGMEKALAKRPDLIRAVFEGEGVLHMAARRNQPIVIEWLLAHGAKLDKRGQWNGTALHWACFFGSKEAAQLLIEKGLDIEDKEDAFGSTPLLWAANGSRSVANPDGDYVATVKMLIEHGASADTYNSEGVPAIRMASSPVAKVLEENGAKQPKPSTRPAMGQVAALQAAGGTSAESL